VQQVGHSIEVQLVPAQLPCPMASQAGAWAIAHLRCQAKQQGPLEAYREQLLC
jgi:hypothetical protein